LTVHGSALPYTPRQETPPAEAREETVGKAVRQLAEQLGRHPPKPATTVDHLDLYMIDVVRGETTLIASEPEKGFDRCGSPSWSNDGRRIVYDAMPGDAVPLTVIKAISSAKAGATVTDLGLGNCPSLSADGDRIVFLNNSRQDQNAGNGVWIMQADGSNRRKLAGYGRPRWSPDDHQFLIIGFDVPCTVTVIDDRPGRKSGQLEISGKALFPDPSWVGDGIIVAPIGSDSAEAIALLDVTQPEEAKVKEVLWKRGKDPDVEPRYPLYSARTHRVVFVGIDSRKEKALYSLERGKNAPPKRLEPGVQSGEIRDLAPSPDGRYVLFSSNRGKDH
jgi:Tol biopolymer transport system component